MIWGLHTQTDKRTNEDCDSIMELWKTLILALNQKDGVETSRSLMSIEDKALGNVMNYIEEFSKKYL